MLAAAQFQQSSVTVGISDCTLNNGSLVLSHLAIRNVWATKKSVGAIKKLHVLVHVERLVARPRQQALLTCRYTEMEDIATVKGRHSTATTSVCP